MQVLKLGTMVTDKISDVKGMLTHLVISIGGDKEYLFQPQALNPETGKPVDQILVQEARIEDGELIDLDIPEFLLGKKAEDRATGFKGRIVSLIHHINGCWHAQIKPKGLNPKTNNTYETCEFDLRRLFGKHIPELTEEEYEKSLIETPSPEPYMCKQR
jgi:hypothetical protein